ncbi:NAD+ synthase (glutamine-hydrolysing) [Jatrophihabitans sp. GAS493]|uniref:NAD+ synthase n=1 Tax=Jatrophihabitans sp. GAS493 TaxID=1907575 RepID=UPI000BB95189|nr:NAD+ synthase [Jatrophihabitans sp. GAS493]SOD74423.1 NAD+ synthase (glutamine-hydrolysing) [Jatrophihabitans sp. GAS493]
MRQLRLALAQVPLIVGDFAANSRAVLEWTAAAAAGGAQLVLFPEMTLTGYPPEDLVFRRSFEDASRATLEALARALQAAGQGEIGVVVGFLDESGGPRNASAFCHRGAVTATYFKHHLPNYGVFDEERYFIPGDRFSLVRFREIDIAMTICEDIWQEGGPFAVAAEVGVDLVVNINGSPYERNKDDVRLELATRRAAEARATVAYVNQVGAQDELVFDGDSFVIASDGKLLARAPQYTEDLYLVDLTFDGAAASRTSTATATATATASMPLDAVDTGTAPVPPYPPVAADIAERICDEAEVWGALVLGTRDYVRKNGFRSVVVAISGGIDSAVVAAIAADAIGGQNVYGVALPSEYSSEHSVSDAVDLAERIGAHYRLIPIAPMVDAFVGSLGLTGVAEENVQARVRGTTLMALSNAEGHLVLATGNKSELAVGYSTIYGDAVGGFAPIKDVPKSLVWALARWRNADAAARGEVEPIPANSIEKPPSAELRPGQLDSDSLPDYELLDEILANYVDGDKGFDSIVKLGFDPELVTRVARMVDTAEWKRRQYPMGPKISFKSFGRDRRLPVTNHWREHPAQG